MNGRERTAVRMLYETTSHFALAETSATMQLAWAGFPTLRGLLFSMPSPASLQGQAATWTWSPRPYGSKIDIAVKANLFGSGLREKFCSTSSSRLVGTPSVNATNSSSSSKLLQTRICSKSPFAHNRSGDVSAWDECTPGLYRYSRCRIDDEREERLPARLWTPPSSSVDTITARHAIPPGLMHGLFYRHPTQYILNLLDLQLYSHRIKLSSSCLRPLHNPPAIVGVGNISVVVRVVRLQVTIELCWSSATMRSTVASKNSPKRSVNMRRSKSSINKFVLEVGAKRRHVGRGTSPHNFEDGGEGLEQLKLSFVHKLCKERLADWQCKIKVWCIGPNIVSKQVIEVTRTCDALRKFLFVVEEIFSSRPEGLEEPAMVCEVHRRVRLQLSTDHSLPRSLANTW